MDPISISVESNLATCAMGRVLITQLRSATGDLQTKELKLT